MKGYMSKYIIIGSILLFLFSNHINGQLFRFSQNRAKNKMIHQIADYNLEKGYHSLIYYKEEDRALLHTVKRLVDTYYPLLKNDLNYNNNEKIIIILHSNEMLLSNAIGVLYSGSPPMGVYYGGTIHILNPEIWNKELPYAQMKENFIAFGPVIHEMVHYIIDMRLKGNYETWFTEGMALYYEYKYTGIPWRADLKGAFQDNFSGDISKDFDSLSEALAYRYAFEIIEAIVLTHGEQGLETIMASLEKGKKTGDIIWPYIM